MVLTSQVLAVDEQIINIQDLPQSDAAISDTFRSKINSKHHSHKHKIKVKEAKVCNAKVYCITQKDVGSDGYCPIRKPGIYRFKENITWCPKKSGTDLDPVAAFKIEVGNVELDLDGFTFKQEGGANYTAGIFITNGGAFSDTMTPPLENIVIRNGTITNVATAGIFVNKVSQLLLENLTIVKNGYSGYFTAPDTLQQAGGIVYPSFIPPTVPFLKNHILRNVHADSNSGSFIDSDFYIVTGALISLVDNLSIENCTFNYNSCGTVGSSVSGGGVGIQLDTSTNVRVVDSQANGNTALGLGYTYGFAAFATNFSFENCQANANTGYYYAEGYGLSPALANSMNGAFSNCSANSNSTTSTTLLGGHTGGFDTQGVGNIFNNCQANNNTSAAGVVYAFFFNSTDASYTDCQANNNSSLLDDNGFVLFEANQVEFTRCTANGNTSEGTLSDSVTSGGAKGFVFVYSYDIAVRDCVAIGQTVNITNATTPTPARGFSLEGATDVKLENCVGSNNYAPLLNGSAAGFHLDGLYITLDKCRAEQNDGALSSNQYELVPLISPNPYTCNIINCLAIGDSTQCNSIGIFMASAISCVLEKNLIENNAQAGIHIEGNCPDNITTQNIIKYNEIVAPNPAFTSLNHCAECIYLRTGMWGIEDLSTGTGTPPKSHNIYYGNASFNYTTNYNTGVQMASTGSTYIVTWAPPAPQPSNVTLLSNLDVVFPTACPAQIPAPCPSPCPPCPVSTPRKRHFVDDKKGS